MNIVLPSCPGSILKFTKCVYVSGFVSVYTVTDQGIRKYCDAIEIVLLSRLEYVHNFRGMRNSSLLNGVPPNKFEQ